VNTVRDEVASDSNPTTPSYDGLIARIESETSRAYEFFTSVKKSATNAEIEDIQRRFNDIDRSIGEAKELRATDETGAITKMIDALSLIQKLIAFLTDIDVRETVTLESLVPVSLTVEERLVNLATLQTEVEASAALVEGRVPYIEDAKIKEKIVMGLEEVRTSIDSLTASLVMNDIAGAEDQAKRAHALVGDLAGLTADVIVPVDVETESIGTTTASEGGTPDAKPDTGTTTEEAPAST
jgi:hypothetical protein